MLYFRPDIVQQHGHHGSQDVVLEDGNDKRKKLSFNKIIVYIFSLCF